MFTVSHEQVSVRPFRLKLWLNLLGPLLGLVLLFILFVALRPNTFLMTRSFVTIARQTTVVGIAAFGMTIVIISGGIDLSVGSIIAVSTVAIAWLLQMAELRPVHCAASPSASSSRNCASCRSLRAWA